MIAALPEMQLMPFLLTALAAFGLGAGMYRFGNRKVRSWAIPLAAAMLFYGLGNYYALPDWAVIGGVLVAPFLFHRLMRRRLENLVRKADYVQAEEGLTLRRRRDYSGKHVAVWTSAPEGPPRVFIDEEREPLVLTLDFEGEAEDEFRVVLQGQVFDCCPGELVAHPSDIPLDAIGILADQEPISELSGLAPDVCVRALPGEYAFRLLDPSTMIAVQDLLRLRSGKREIYVHIKGPQMRIVATDVYEAKDIPSLLKAGAILFRKVRAIGLERL